MTQESGHQTFKFTRGDRVVYTTFSGEKRTGTIIGGVLTLAVGRRPRMERYNIKLDDGRPANRSAQSLEFVN